MASAKAEKRKLFFSMIYPTLFVVALWIIKGIELQFDLDFGKYGILPRNLEGLRGVLLAPLIHANLEHLTNNSVPLLLLGTALFYFYRSLAFRIIILSYLLSSLYTWISARYSYHIGASGVVYALFAFLLVSGFIRRHLQLIAISFLVAFFYGSLVWGILPWDHKISWEGHFWGFMVGIILAIYYRKQGPQRKIHVWEEEDEDEDEDGYDYWEQDDEFWKANSSEEVKEWKYWIRK
ncbi:MAG: rhomboid family intramembrane serine protease [Flavobacteriales bacterium]|nr:rhomboid family intramembrane serine protease [Flavobacteriales bacterium]